jgi:hypothetical protein
MTPERRGGESGFVHGEPYGRSQPVEQVVDLPALDANLSGEGDRLRPMDELLEFVEQRSRLGGSMVHEWRVWRSPGRVFAIFEAEDDVTARPRLREELLTVRATLKPPRP